MQDGIQSWHQTSKQIMNCIMYRIIVELIAVSFNRNEEGVKKKWRVGAEETKTTPGTYILTTAYNLYGKNGPPSVCI